MKWIYFRWGLILLAVLTVALFGLQRYQREVTTVSPEAVVNGEARGTLRVVGMVQAGSLEGQPPYREAAFRLEGPEEGFMVQYAGEPPDNLRELKTLVVVGKWNPSAQIFKAHEIDILPNYGYVVAAYLIGMLPLGFFLFRMERQVKLLYNEIKTTTVYEPEAGFDKG